ncbi:MAG: heavy metal-associated domain-containing protein [Candidatus Neomarinimicrobiota bacterium]|nr:heavy metal-associated domain-containing protein [Candidatus Neomarinimicrobiota bacterium]
MKKTPLIAIVAVALVILVGGNYDGAVETASISIDGMSCGSCTSKVETVLSKQAGVKTVSVDLDAKLATVEYYPSKVAKAELVTTVSKAGFTASEAACEYSTKKAKTAAAEGASCDYSAKKAKTAAEGASCSSKAKTKAI